MCGITGFLRRQGFAGDEARAQLVRMTDTLVRRGPDSNGYWLDSVPGVALGHRRLAIVDLSPAGSQPMQSVGGRYVIAFNGEIYNHQALRLDLEQRGLAPTWRGHSDTETLLAGFVAWGIRGTVERAIGMFAFSVWDRSTRTLVLGRDRVGEKPLYYGWQGEGSNATFLFGSELAALKAHPAFRAEIDRGSLCLLMRHNCVPAPYSIYQGIRKLTPGSLLEVTSERWDAEAVKYWSAAHVAMKGCALPYEGTAEQAVDELELLLRSAVRQQMVADVPLGAFLSGGVDSSTVVALMQAQSDHPVKTFTIGFTDAGYNEALHAKTVAKHLGTEHCELYVTPRQALEVIPLLPSLYSEPFSDSSQIPTFLVAQLARQHVTVSLSGDGGDELFGGYNRYVLAHRLWRKVSHLPVRARRIIAGALTTVSPDRWNSLLEPIQRRMPASLRQANLGEKVHKGAGILASSGFDALYLGLVSHWADPSSLVIRAREPSTLLAGAAPELDGLDDIQRMMALDLLTYLPDDVLVKVDRAAIGSFSREPGPVARPPGRGACLASASIDEAEGWSREVGASPGPVPARTQGVD